MASRREAWRIASTHDVTNQVPPLQDVDWFTTDRALVEALTREGGGWAEDRVAAYGAALGRDEVMRWGRQANAHPPELRAHDAAGNRIDEVEFHPAWHEVMRLAMAHEVHNLEMVHHTRLDCVSGSAGLMRQALAQATHHAAHRSAFGRLLSEQPLMQNVLADLAVEVEAATALLMRLARAYDEAARAFARVATAVAKYWVCKRAPSMIYEAMECLGGNGYVEDSILPRLYREAPVNAIWEGSGNVICLDVWRAMLREPDCAPALLDEIRLGRGSHPALDRAIAEIETALAEREVAETHARRWVERMALALQGSLLVRSAPGGVARREIVERASPTN